MKPRSRTCNDTISHDIVKHKTSALTKTRRPKRHCACDITARLDGIGQRLDAIQIELDSMMRRLDEMERILKVMIRLLNEQENTVVTKSQPIVYTMRPRITAPIADDTATTTTTTTLIQPVKEPTFSAPHTSRATISIETCVSSLERATSRLKRCVDILHSHVSALATLLFPQRVLVARRACEIYFAMKKDKKLLQTHLPSSRQHDDVCDIDTAMSHQARFLLVYGIDISDIDAKELKNTLDLGACGGMTDDVVHFLRVRFVEICGVEYGAV